MNKKKSRADYRIMGNDEILRYTWKKYGKNISPLGLHQRDSKLYDVLREKKLNGRLKSQKKYVNMNNSALLNYLWEKYGRNISPTELHKKDGGLYCTLWKRGLNTKLKGKIRPRGFYNNKTDDELIEYTKRKHGYIGRGELQKKDRMLYDALLRRHLIGNFKSKRKYTGMSNEELIEYTKNTYGKKISPGELARKNGGLYYTLRKRGLIEKLERVKRDWKNMSDDELIKYSKQIYGGISSGELFKKDSGLYIVLMRRGLLSKLNQNTVDIESILDAYVGGEDE